jgi:radical SAM protein with 4Fe4S-binding SPASM domain
MARIRAGGCELAFPTNGTLLEKYAERLVDNGPTVLWVSLDGPAAVNNRQRGSGVFERAVRGLARLGAVKCIKGSRHPKLGIACVVTPDNFEHIETLFLETIDLGLLDFISIELQSYATRAQANAYGEVLGQEFAVKATPCAEAYVRDPGEFGRIDCDSLARQMARVAAVAAERGILFHSQPQTITADNLRRYFSADWQALADRRSRCGVPWLTAEISARGEVSTCHSFYDLSVGNIYDQPLLEIWRGERLARLRHHLRNQLFPICTACCRYYGGANALPSPGSRHG